MASDRQPTDSKADLELRKGVLVLAVLSRLRTPEYGYSLRQALAQSDMQIEEGTLYPLLRRLEGQGLLTSEWRIEQGPPRRYYWLSIKGRRLYSDLTQSWRGLVETLDLLIEEDPPQKRKRAS